MEFVALAVAKRPVNCMITNIIEVQRTPKTKKIKSIIMEVENFAGITFIIRATKHIDNDDEFRMTVPYSWKELCEIAECY